MEYQLTLTGGGFTEPHSEPAPTIATVVRAAFVALNRSAGPERVSITINGPHGPLYASQTLNGHAETPRLAATAIYQLIDELRCELHRKADAAELPDGGIPGSAHPFVGGWICAG